MSAAFSYGTQVGEWTCSGRTRLGRRGLGRQVCTQMTVGAPSLTSSVEGSLTYDSTIPAIIRATNTATLMLRQYGFNSYSGCTAPHGFAVTAGTMGITCIAYDPGGTFWVTVPDRSLFPVGGITSIDKSSWADVLSNGTTALCSGPSPPEIATDHSHSP